MNAFAVRIWPLLLIVALIAFNAVGGSPLHIKNKNGITGRQGSDEVYPSIPFHRGHLVPKQTYSSTEKSTKSTYTYTNAVPQRPFLNSGMWSKYEEKIRWYGKECTRRDGVLYLLTGIAYFFIHYDGKFTAIYQAPEVLKPEHNPKHFGIVIPNSLWTAGCCVSPTAVGNFAVIGNNLQRREKGGITGELKVSQLEDLLQSDLRLTNGQHVNLFPANNKCRADDNDIDLPTAQPDFGLPN